MRLFFFLAGLFACHGTAGAQTDLCPPYDSSVRVSFSTRLIEPTYNHDLSIGEVRSLYSTRGQRISRSHSNAIGITYAEIGLGISASTRSYRRERGGYCVYLDEVVADFGFDKFEVYIGREYRKGTCEYRTILDHENEHVAINNAVVKDYGPRIRRTIEQQLEFMPPLFAPTVDTGAQRAVRELQQRIEPTVQALKREQRRRNAAIDTDENYGALQNLCRNWSDYRNF